MRIENVTHVTIPAREAAIIRPRNSSVNWIGSRPNKGSVDDAICPHVHGHEDQRRRVSCDTQSSMLFSVLFSDRIRSSLKDPQAAPSDERRFHRLVLVVD